MIVTERVFVNGREFIYTYSDRNMRVCREGVLYDEAYDPVESNREYTESEVEREAV